MRSMNTGFDEMCALLHDFSFDVFGVSETWLHPYTPSDNYNVPGYTLLRADRRHDHKTGGGVAVYVKEGISFERYTLADVDPDIDHLSIVIKVRGVKIGICIVYRPPDVKYTCLETLFHSLFIDMAVEVDSVLYLGDTNINLLSETDNSACYLRRLMKLFGTVQQINEPTRVTANSITLIDHNITDRSVQLSASGVINAASLKDHRGVRITDHMLVYGSLILYPEKKRNVGIIKYRDYSNFDIDQVLSAVQNVSWNSAVKIQQVDDIERYVSSNIKTIFDKFAPIVTKRVTKKKAPWRNCEIVKLTKVKNKLLNKYRKYGCYCDWVEYKIIRNRLNGLIRRAKKEFFTNKLTGCEGSKEFWTCLRRGDVVGGRSNAEVPLEFDVKTINEFFINMGSEISADVGTEDFYKTNVHDGLKASFCFKVVSDEEVKSAMNEITSLSVGSDDISIEMVKAISPFALTALTHLLNSSLQSGEFPQSWKTTIIHPLPKKTNPSNFEQLRPISILPAMSKILEKIATRQIVNFMEENKLFPKLQSGFRKNHSTSTALVNMFADLFETRDKGRCSTLVMLDYSQAFDSISHDMLLAKMHYFGFQENAVNWVRSYLKDRQQVTKLGPATSPPLFKTRGVPQGSCLGPVLFILYTSDLSSCVSHCSTHSYADDLQLHLSYDPRLVAGAISDINSDLNNISAWSVNHGLKLNVTKCTVLHVAAPHLLHNVKKCPVQVILDGENLVVSDTVKTLGVLLDSNLLFTDHVTYASQQALGRLRGLYRFKSLLPESAKLQIVKSLILPVFYYCYPSYGNSISREDTERIQKIQNTALRFVYGLKKHDHVSSYRDTAKLMPMREICRTLTLCMTHKALTLKEPLYLSERLQSREQVAARSTRHVQRLHFPKVRLEIGRKGFNYFGPSLYNSLPCSLKVKPFTIFKRNVKSFLEKPG